MGIFIVRDRNGVRRVPVVGQMTIGRSQGNDLVLNSMFISRRHARVWRQGERVIIEDLSSTNGTFVNGQRLTHARFLHHNDVIMMGDGRLIFVCQWDRSREPTPPQGLPRLLASQVFCPRCGAPNPPQASVCARCGAELVAGGARTRSGVQVSAPEPASFTPAEPVVARPFSASRPLRRQQRSGVWLLILLLAIITVAFLTILALLVFYTVS